MNMKTALMVFQMVPTIIELVKNLEETVSEPGQGKSKLQLVRELIEAVFENVDEVWPAVEKVVGAVVVFMNAFGVFKK